MRRSTIIYSIVFILTATLFVKCSGDYTGKELQEWLTNEENGLKKSVENEFFKIEVQYRPLDFMISSQYKGEEITKQEYKKEVTGREGLQYFNIKLQSKKGKEVLKTALQSEEEYAVRLGYYINGFKNDLKLIDGKDTLDCKLYHFERTYGIVDFNNVSVAFENTNDDKENKQFLILDRVLGFGFKEIKFQKEDLKNIPRLKTK